MIEKILDKYYSKKLMEFLDRQLLEWFIDKRYLIKDTYVSLQIKKCKYNDSEYKEIITFAKKDAFIYLCNQSELKKVLRQCVQGYFEHVKGK